MTPFKLMTFRQISQTLETHMLEVLSELNVVVSIVCMNIFRVATFKHNFEMQLVNINLEICNRSVKLIIQNFTIKPLKVENMKGTLQRGGAIGAEKNIDFHGNIQKHFDQNVCMCFLIL